MSTYRLCYACGNVTLPSLWVGLDYVDDEDEPRPVPSTFTDPMFLVCPLCNYRHKDGDDGPGFEDFTTEFEARRKAQEYEFDS